MRDVSNTTRFDGYGETCWEDRNSSAIVAGKESYKELIRKANTVPLIRVFRHYGVRVDAVHCMTICPLKSHKGGRENSASFKYFSETNSFYCYGCKVGGEFAHSCEFMAAMEDITRPKAANKILRLFADGVDEVTDLIDIENFSERLEIMVNFSNVIREFRQDHFDDKSFAFIEEVCRV
jgi:hypothetical protein